MKGRRNAIVPSENGQDVGSEVNVDDLNLGTSKPQLVQTPQLLRIPSPVGWETTREPRVAGSRTAASVLAAKGKPSGIPRPIHAVSKAQQSPPLPPKQADTAWNKLSGEISYLRHKSINLSGSASARGSRSRGPQFHSRNNLKTDPSTPRSNSVALGASTRSRVRSRVSTSGQSYGKDQLWYEVGTPTPPPRNKRLSTVEKHKEAFQSSLAQSSSVLSSGSEETQFRGKVPQAVEDVEHEGK
ncbi:MAG: hypothetical protein Q9208_007102 [Pyrenodesmia sp. 3 TL-2023]